MYYRLGIFEDEREERNVWVGRKGKERDAYTYMHTYIPCVVMVHTYSQA